MRIRIAFAIVLLCSSGCLVFERQSLVIRTPKPGEKSGEVLMTYEGLHCSEPDDKEFERACNQLKELAVSRERCYVGHFMMPIAVAEPKEMESLESKVQRLLYKKNLRIGQATFFRDPAGRLCAYQVIAIPDVPAFLTDLNAAFNARLLLNEGLFNLDPEGLKAAREAANKNHAWLSVEPGRIVLTAPLPPSGAVSLKRSFLEPDRFDSLVGQLDQLVNPKPDQEKLDLEEFKRRIRRQAEDLDAMANNPISIDQRKDRVTASLGLGDGLPIDVLAGRTHLDPKALKSDAKFGEFVEKLGRPIEKGTDAEKIRKRFLAGELKE